jgi:hypothetical protein
MAAVVTPTSGVVDDIATLREAKDWIRKIALDGLHMGFVDAMGQDRALALTARLDEMQRRTAQTGVLRRGDGESDMEHARRHA